MLVSFAVGLGRLVWMAELTALMVVERAVPVGILGAEGSILNNGSHAQRPEVLCPWRRALRAEPAVRL